ncbi:hypothetical protein VPLG_00079 [Vibrio phage eugene 12A10]|uniref:hypothetical protein n=1 Tax=Vibrio phage eugene 12A10 TaxID=573172 RepID=UPI000351FED0|nr:hypothetical protein VPLG_00079 [Vibrio phage eugene 12A10]AGN51518.1 hypothetical protein VPLG_00079 [Vibrio phage eugene 12A10]
MYRYRIGFKFLSSNGGDFTIIDRKDGYYFLNCKNCGDSNIWSEEGLKVRSGSVEKKSVLCLCSSKLPELSESQATKLFTEKCKNFNLKFLGWKTTFSGLSRTKAKILYPDGGIKETTYSNLRGKDYTPKSKRPSLSVAKTESDEKLKTIIEKIHPTYTFLGRDTKNTRYANVMCSICSYDTYVDNKLCGGVFTSFIGSLKGTPKQKPSKPCRCNPRPNWTRPQREFTIKDALRDCKGLWIGWIDEDSKLSYTSKFNWVCKRGHPSQTSVDNFLRGKRCKSCRDENTKMKGRFNGYDPTRTQDADLLYVLSFREDYSKCGRSFILEDRFKQSRGIIKMSGYPCEDIEVVSVYTGTHQQVYDTEQWLLKETKDRGLYYNSGWTTESRTVDAIPLLIKLVEEHSDLIEVDYVEGM